MTEAAPTLSRDPALLAAHAEKIPTTLYINVKGMLRKLPPGVTEQFVGETAIATLEALPPEVSIPEPLAEKLPGIYEFVSDVTGFSAEDLPPLDATTTIAGRYFPLFHSATVGITDKEPLQHAILETLDESIAVHEIAHGARDLSSARTVGIIVPERTSVFVSGGFDKARIDRSPSGNSVIGRQPVGNIYEEAWAEQVTKRYLAAHGLNAGTAGLYDGPDSQITETGLSNEYVRQHGGFNYASYTSLAGYAIDLLDECRAQVNPNSRPLFEIMKDARHAKTQATAQREFIATIDSVRPGLYKELRDLEYTADDFAKSVEIAKNLHDQLVPVAPISQSV